MIPSDKDEKIMNNRDQPSIVLLPLLYPERPDAPSFFESLGSDAADGRPGRMR